MDFLWLTGNWEKTLYYWFVWLRLCWLRLTWRKPRSSIACCILFFFGKTIFVKGKEVCLFVCLRLCLCPSLFPIGPTDSRNTFLYTMLYLEIQRAPDNYSTTIDLTTIYLYWVHLYPFVLFLPFYFSIFIYLFLSVRLPASYSQFYPFLRLYFPQPLDWIEYIGLHVGSSPSQHRTIGISCYLIRLIAKIIISLSGTFWIYGWFTPLKYECEACLDIYVMFTLDICVCVNVSVNIIVKVCTFATLVMQTQMQRMSLNIYFFKM